MMKKPEAEAAVNKEWDKFQKLPAWDEKKVKSKSEVISQAKNDGKNISLRKFNGPLSLEERRNCKTPPEIQGASYVKDENGYRAVFT